MNFNGDQDGSAIIINDNSTEQKINMTVQSGSGFCECLFFFSFLIADILLLYQYKDATCDQPLSLWIIINLVVWILAIIFKSINTSNCTVKTFSLLAMLAHLGMLVWGYIIYLNPGNCDTVMIGLYKLILAHIIVHTIWIALSICILFFACGCLCCIGGCLLCDEYNDKKESYKLYTAI